jgi:hypothetical protein
VLRARVATTAVLVAALVLVVVLAVIVAGHGRDDFKSGSVAELNTALTKQGLAVCSSGAPDSGSGDGGSISRQVLEVALRGKCGDAIDLRVDAYEDASHRDSAARAAEIQERGHHAGVVYTWHKYTVYLQGDDASTATAVRDRVVDALDSVGAK